MPRTVSDATRFTATSPHAYSKPNENLRSAASNTFSPSNNSRTYPSAYNAHSSPSGPIQFSGSTETPAQKVVRLRAAHAAEKNAEITTWDKIVVKGRVWADVAHRVTVWGLIGATVIAGGVTAFALGDMIIYNRRKRRLFYEEQRLLLGQRLAEAREAQAKGLLNEDQLLLLNRERAADEAEAARKAEKGVWKSIKSIFLIDELKEESIIEGQHRFSREGRKIGDGPVQTNSEAGASAASGSQNLVVESASHGSSSPNQDPLPGKPKVPESGWRNGEHGLQDRGVEAGPLDRMAEQAVAAGRAKGGWTSWITSK